MARFVRIHSQRPIRVTPGLQTVNVTNYESQNPNKLNVKPSWASMIVAIKAGTGYYPAVIKQWNTVKILSEKQVLTIGEETDNVPEEFKAEAEELAKRIEQKMKAYAREKETLETVDPKAPKKKAPKEPSTKKEDTLFPEE